MNFIADPTLVLYLPLYELDGASFASKDAYGHLCTVTGALWTPGGRSFDGSDDKIDCGNPAALQITGNLTLEAWFNMDSQTGWKRIISKDDGSSNRSYFMHTSSGALVFGIFKSNTQYDLRGSIDLRGAGWKHAVGVNDGTNLTQYIDAIEELSEVEGGIIDNDPVDLYLASRSDGVEYWKGYIGEIRIYNRALSPQEIQRNYLATKWRYK